MSPLSAAVRRAALLCVLFVAVSVAGVTLSPHADAQYPGGGSGGGYPGGLSPGWHPIKPDGTPGNDTLGDPYIFYDYDWTRLELHFDGVHGPPNDPTWSAFSFDGVYSPNTISGYQGVDSGSSPYPGQPAPPDRILNLSIKGTSTIKYQWVPPDYPGTSLPDWTDFPAPPLFVLGRVDGRASAQCSSTTGDLDGISGEGSYTDGFGGSPLTYSTVPGDTGAQVGRKVLTASGSPAQVTLSPAVTANLLGHGTGSANGGGWIEERVFPLTLASPDPLTNPVLGDGTNQYVYDSGSPGRVNVPAVISVLGANTDDTGWLVNGSHVDVAIAPAISGQQPHTWDAFENYIGFGGYFTFVGLPTQYNGSADDPNSFGNHEAILKVDGKNSQFAHFQTFFTTNATNWPNSDGITPNWFHYYQQLAPFSIIYDPDLSAAGMCTTSYLFNHNTKEYVILGSVLTMGPSAIQYTPVPVFEVGPSGLVRVAGTVKMKGILCYLFVSGHEVGHEAAIFQRVQVPYIDNMAPAGVTDTDADGVPDSWETAHHLDPEDPDTAKYYGQMSDGPDEGKGDSESLASMIGVGRMLQYSGLWKQDWADLGVQYGRLPAYVPFRNYDPRDLSQYPSNSLPATALTDWP